MSRYNILFANFETQTVTEYKEVTSFFLIVLDAIEKDKRGQLLTVQTLNVSVTA